MAELYDGQIRNPPPGIVRKPPPPPAPPRIGEWDEVRKSVMSN